MGESACSPKNRELRMDEDQACLRFVVSARPGPPSWKAPQRVRREEAAHDGV